MTGRNNAGPRSYDVAQMRKDYDREIYALRHELEQLRLVRQQAAVHRSGGQMLLTIIDRYRKAFLSIGWTPPDDERAIVEQIRKDFES